MFVSVLVRLSICEFRLTSDILEILDMFDIFAMFAMFELLSKPVVAAEIDIALLKSDKSEPAEERSPSVDVDVEDVEFDVDVDVDV